ncbi:hypothetical protein HHI36_010459 [Cryptolaemus montrouzieri]|uniref:Uncharacterized protein n=1 Tax=Cryptolaemus montrouzieri TaxID=559131 RepID=A0ABD2MIV2_9CUCU
MKIDSMDQSYLYNSLKSGKHDQTTHQKDHNLPQPNIAKEKNISLKTDLFSNTTASNTFQPKLTLKSLGLNEIINCDESSNSKSDLVSVVDCDKLLPVSVQKPLISMNLYKNSNHVLKKFPVILKKVNPKEVPAEVKNAHKLLRTAQLKVVSANTNKLHLQKKRSLSELKENPFDGVNISNVVSLCKEKEKSACSNESDIKKIKTEMNVNISQIKDISEKTKITDAKKTESEMKISKPESNERKSGENALEQKTEMKNKQYSKQPLILNRQLFKKPISHKVPLKISTKKIKNLDQKQIPPQIKKRKSPLGINPTSSRSRKSVHRSSKDTQILRTQNSREDRMDDLNFLNDKFDSENDCLEDLQLNNIEELRQLWELVLELYRYNSAMINQLHVRRRRYSFSIQKLERYLTQKMGLGVEEQSLEEHMVLAQEQEILPVENDATKPIDKENKEE